MNGQILIIAGTGIAGLALSVAGLLMVYRYTIKRNFMGR